MKPVTRTIRFEAAHDLLERVPRACVGFAGPHGAQSLPVALRWRAGRYLLGIPAGAAEAPQNGQEVVLLVDEGVYFFDLRACYVRGVLAPAAAASLPAGYAWHELVPGKTVAWDYGMLHEVRNEP